MCVVFRECRVAFTESRSHFLFTGFLCINANSSITGVNTRTNLSCYLKCCFKIFQFCFIKKKRHFKEKAVKMLSNIKLRRLWHKNVNCKSCWLLFVKIRKFFDFHPLLHWSPYIILFFSTRGWCIITVMLLVTPPTSLRLTPHGQLSSLAFIPFTVSIVVSSFFKSNK